MHFLPQRSLRSRAKRAVNPNSRLELRRQGERWYPGPPSRDGLENVFISDEPLGLGERPQLLAGIAELFGRDIPAKRFPHDVAGGTVLFPAELLKFLLQLGREANRHGTRV